jgi:hypothetical protein
MDITILALILGVVGATVYYIDQTFIQKNDTDMNSTFKVFLLSAGIVFLTSFFLDDSDVQGTQSGGGGGVEINSSRIASNQDMMTGNAPF